MKALSWMKGRAVPAVGLASLAVAVALFTGLRASENAKPAGADVARQAVQVLDGSTLRLSDATLAGLGTVRARTRPFPDTLALQGDINVVENLMTVVPCRVGNARVDRVLKVTGETVRAGEPLALVFSPDYVSAREEYLQIIGKKGRGGDLGGFAEVAREKLETMGLTPKDIADLPRSKDHELVVRAIRDGVITSVNTMEGNLQNLGDTLFTTANLDKVWFSGDLYIEDLPRARKGQKILINAEGLDRPMSGTLSFISPVVDANVRTVKVRALIDNPGHLLRASMFVEGTLVLSDRDALVVPRDAVLKLDGRAFCFKGMGERRFKEVPVTLGREGGGLVAVAKGLKPGDELVAGGLDTLDNALDSARGGD